MSATIGSLHSRPINASDRVGWLRDRFAALLDAERGRFVLWLPVFLAAGTVLYFTRPAEPPLAAALAAAGLGLLLCVLLRCRRLCCCAALAVTAVALGFAAGSLATWRAPALEKLPTRAVVLSATIELVEILPDGRRITLRGVQLPGEAAPLVRSVRVRLQRNDATALQAGDQVQVRAVLMAPAPPAWPGAWDLQRDAFFAGRAGGGTALAPVTVLRHATPSGIVGWWFGLRAGLAQRFLTDLPGTPGAIAATLFTGLTSAIPEPDRAAFRDSGLAHLLAVAGLHIGAVMGAVFALLRWGLARWERASLFWPCKQIAAGSALAVGLLYLLLTGAHIPIERSFAMACLATAGLLAGRRVVSLRGLALAATAIILVAPQEVAGVSFEMSFSAVLALIAGYEAMRPLLHRLKHRRWLAHLAALALTSLLAGVASAPFAAYHFGQVQLYFILANLVAVPITALLVMPAGLVSLLLMPFGLEQLALWPMGLAIQMVLWIGHTVSALPDATLPVPQMPGWGIVLVSLGMAWLGLWRSRLRLALLPVLLIGLASPWLVTPPDLLVSADARLIALRTPQGVTWQSHSAARFTRESWLQMWGVRPTAAPGPLPCAAPGCLVRPGPDLPAVLIAKSGAPVACGAAVLVVSAEPARGVCPGVALIDRFTVWREGAQAVWLRPDGVVVLSDHAWRGARPWVPVAIPRAVAPTLPMADRDEPVASLDAPVTRQDAALVRHPAAPDLPMADGDEAAPALSVRAQPSG